MVHKGHGGMEAGRGRLWPRAKEVGTYRLALPPLAS